jgi:hypothetical protein
MLVRNLADRSGPKAPAPAGSRAIVSSSAS